MSDLYVPIRSDRVADLSAAIHQIKRPPAVRDPNDEARYAYAWFDHPSGNGWSLLRIPAEEDVPVHVAADGALLAATLQVFLADGRITEAEFAGLLEAIPALAGETARIADLIPPSWRSQVLDREGAIAAGFIPEEPTE